MTQLEITGDPVQLGTDGLPLPKETHLVDDLEQHGERFWQRYHLTLKVPWKLPIGGSTTSFFVLSFQLGLFFDRIVKIAHIVEQRDDGSGLPDGLAHRANEMFQVAFAGW